MRFSLTFRLFVIAALAVLMLCDPAFASDSHGHAEEKGGLDFTGIKRWDLGIYTLIVFFLLIAILSKFAWPAIKEGLEKREAAIIGAQDEAKRDRKEALDALTEAKKQLDAASAQVKAMLDEARRDADVLKNSEREAGVKDAAAERERAKREIDTAKDVALKEIYEQAVKLAAMMSEKALRRQVSSEDHKRLLDESIAELKGASKA
jgi:F-type H+-transporting ATPase subunit b